MKTEVTVKKLDNGNFLVSSPLELTTSNPDKIGDLVESIYAAIELMSRDEQDEQNQAA